MPVLCYSTACPKWRHLTRICLETQPSYLLSFKNSSTLIDAWNIYFWTGLLNMELSTTKEKDDCVESAEKGRIFKKICKAHHTTKRTKALFNYSPRWPWFMIVCTNHIITKRTWVFYNYSPRWAWLMIICTNPIITKKTWAFCNYSPMVTMTDDHLH